MVLLIDDATLKQYTYTNKNVRDLTNSIELAQEIHIKPAIGTVLLTALQFAITSGTLVPGSDLDNLNNLLKRSLAYWSLYEAAPFIHYQVSETGIINRAGGDNTSTEEVNLEIFMTKIRNTADLLLNQSLDYINRNIHSFPQYQAEFNTKDVERGKGRSLGGILFTDSYTC